jgi:hypothetical protein
MGRWVVLGLISVAVAAVVGCNGEGDDGGSGAGGQTAGSGGTSATACDETQNGVCQNEMDCPLVRGGQARSTASSCGIGCLGDTDEATCGAECVVAESDLTAECAACYIAIVDCSRDHCLIECAGDPEGGDCFDCQVANGCRTAFDECSGLSTGG